MKKLFNLKEWLTIADTARHLSIVFGEEVSEADVLRLALDGHLKLSVNFVNHALARMGKVMPISEARLVPGLLLKEDQKPYMVMLGLALNDHEVLDFGKEVMTLKGVYDLPMIGSERLDVEHECQRQTGGPAVTLVGLDGVFVEEPDGQLCQLQASYDDNKYQSGSKAQLEELKQHIASHGTEKVEAEKLLNKHRENRRKYLERKKSRPASEDYHPAGGLPEDSVLVVRTDALRRFEQAINNTPINADKPITTTERKTLLTIIAALCDYSAIKPLERGVAAQISKMTEEIGAVVTDDTIRKVLAKIPDALETRKK